MIVNVNPYDTGYDENSHVMKFAALAREVYVTPAPAPLQRIPTLPGASKTVRGKIKDATQPPSNPSSPAKPLRRKVTISFGGTKGGRRPSETVLEVVEGESISVELAALLITQLQRMNPMMTKAEKMTMTNLSTPLWICCSMKSNLCACR